MQYLKDIISLLLLNVLVCKITHPFLRYHLDKGDYHLKLNKNHCQLNLMKVIRMVNIKNLHQIQKNQLKLVQIRNFYKWILLLHKFKIIFRIDF